MHHTQSLSQFLAVLMLNHSSVTNEFFLQICQMTVFEKEFEIDESDDSCSDVDDDNMVMIINGYRLYMYFYCALRIMKGRT